MGVPPPFKTHRGWRNVVFLSGNHAEAWAHGGGGVAYIYIYIYFVYTGGAQINYEALQEVRTNPNALGSLQGKQLQSCA